MGRRRAEKGRVIEDSAGSRGMSDSRGRLRGKSSRRGRRGRPPPGNGVAGTSSGQERRRGHRGRGRGHSTSARGRGSASGYRDAARGGSLRKKWHVREVGRRSNRGDDDDNGGEDNGGEDDVGSDDGPCGKLHGMYWDPDQNRYFAGTRPPGLALRARQQREEKRRRIEVAKMAASVRAVPREPAVPSSASVAWDAPAARSHGLDRANLRAAGFGAARARRVDAGLANLSWLVRARNVFGVRAACARVRETAVATALGNTAASGLLVARDPGSARGVGGRTSAGWSLASSRTEADGPPGALVAIPGPDARIMCVPCGPGMLHRLRPHGPCPASRTVPAADGHDGVVAVAVARDSARGAAAEPSGLVAWLREQEGRAGARAAAVHVAPVPGGAGGDAIMGPAISRKAGSVALAFTRDARIVASLVGGRLHLHHLAPSRMMSTLTPAAPPGSRDPRPGTSLATDLADPNLIIVGARGARPVLIFDLRTWSPGTRPELSLPAGRAGPGSRNAAAAVCALRSLGNGRVATLDTNGTVRALDPRGGDARGPAVEFSVGTNRGTNVGFTVNPAGDLAAVELPVELQRNPGGVRARPSVRLGLFSLTTGAHVGATQSTGDGLDAAGIVGFDSDLHGAGISLPSMWTKGAIVELTRPVGHLPLTIEWPDPGVILAASGGDISTVQSASIP